jgi:hypothetical protein
MTVKQEVNVDVKQKWWGWHKLNPHFYEMFERFALTLISNGHSNSSAWLVVNRSLTTPDCFTTITQTMTGFLGLRN